jgi:hypothetical protein
MEAGGKAGVWCVGTVAGSVTGNGSMCGGKLGGGSEKSGSLTGAACGATAAPGSDGGGAGDRDRLGGSCRVGDGVRDLAGGVSGLRDSAARSAPVTSPSTGSPYCGDTGEPALLLPDDEWSGDCFGEGNSGVAFREPEARQKKSGQLLGSGYTKKREKNTPSGKPSRLS